jgi:hypothetical protein
MPESPFSNIATNVAEAPKPSSSNADDIANYLKGDDKTEIPLTDDKVEKPKDKDKPKADELTDELEDLELKEGEDEEDKLDLEKPDEDITIDSPPRKKEIVEKYPNFFKEFPFFEKMMFRDKQYTELFGSYDDAVEINDKVQVFENFEQDVMQGNLKGLLQGIKNVDGKAFDKIVDNYLSELFNVDKDAGLEVVSNVGKYIIKELANQSKNSNNEDMHKVAVFLNQFLFNSQQLTPMTKRVNDTEDKESERVNRERSEFVQERFEISVSEVQTKVDNTLKSTIADYIDPKGEMTPYTKRNAIRDALNQLHELLNQDPAFVRHKNKLWENAAANRFSQDSLRGIISTYLGKSKQSLKTVIMKARTEALKGANPTSHKRDEDEEERTPQRRGPISTGRPRQSSGGKNEGRKPGESVLEYLSRD